MELLSPNPFNTIKANDLNDAEINAQWVALPKNRFMELFSPTSSDAKIIIGGKGSGKTHLMRYFSYQAQLVRNSGSPAQGIINDGYFGVYFQASGLNGSRFDELPFEETKKLHIFSYYFELWLTGQFLEALKKLKETTPDLFRDEQQLCNDILSLFDEAPNQNPVDCLDDIHEVIRGLIKRVDLDINNYHFVSEFKTRIMVTRGNLIFGIPKLLTQHSTILKDTNFLYLADELENISKGQQKYFNTLIRERKLPVTFRIGVRRHGIKTYDTMGAGEPNKEDHEFQVVRLDNEFASEEQYASFATELILNRLVAAELAPKELLENPEKPEQVTKRKNYLDSLFENADIYRILQHSTKRRDSSPVKAFIPKLKKSLDQKSVDAISTALTYSKDPIVEKAALHLLCQKWNKVANANQLVTEAREIQLEIEKYEGDQENQISSKISYFSNNYTSSCLRFATQNNLDIYTGFDNLLKITKGYPRHILTVLRHIYKIEAFSGQKIFSQESPVSVRAQNLSLKESCDWFHDDCVTEGILGNDVAIFLDRLCGLLRLEYYADKPVECSASSFTLKKASLPKKLQNILDWAVMIRVIIPAPQLRQGKNDQDTENRYYLNGLLCPRWGLPINRRGALSFGAEEAVALLDTSSEDAFSELKKRFSKDRYAPYKFKEGKETATKNKEALPSEDKPEQQGLDF